MNISDIVVWNEKVAIITELYESKVWRTAELGKKVHWGAIEPEPFARILVDGVLKGVPLTDLKLINEAR